MSWDVQQRIDDAPVQVPGVALVLRPWPEAGHAAPLVVGVELEVQAEGALGGSMPQT